MRKILFIIWCLWGVAEAQTVTQPQGAPNVLIANKGFFSIDSLFFFPNRTDTNFTPIKPGAALFRTGDKALYIWTGVKWNGYYSYDTTSLSNRINLKLNISDTMPMLVPYAKIFYVDQQIHDSLTSSTLQRVTTNGNTTVNGITVGGKSSFSSDSGWVATGTLGNGIIPVEGNGVRLMWYPRKAAFKVGGQNTGSPWNGDSTGIYTFGAGLNVKTLGDYSAAIGVNAQAIHSGSQVYGTNTISDFTNQWKGGFQNGYYFGLNGTVAASIDVSGFTFLGALVADPVGVAGRFYYNSLIDKFRAYEGGVWKDMIPPTGGSVTSVSVSSLNPLFNTVVTNPTGAVNVAYTLQNATPNTWFGNSTGVSGAPSYNAAGTLSKTDDTNVTLTLGGTPIASLLKSVSMTLGWTGTLGISRGGTGLGTTPTNGQLLIGNGTGYTLGTLTAGSGISIVNGVGTITITNTGGGGGASSGGNITANFN